MDFELFIPFQSNRNRRNPKLLITAFQPKIQIQHPKLLLTAFPIQNSKSKIHNCLLMNQAAVSANPSSIVKGGFHPSSCRIFELSTVNDPVNLGLQHSKTHMRKVRIKSKTCRQFQTFHQNKAGTICQTEILVFIFSEEFKRQMQ